MRQAHTDTTLPGIPDSEPREMQGLHPEPSKAPLGRESTLPSTDTKLRVGVVFEKQPAHSWASLQVTG